MKLTFILILKIEVQCIPYRSEEWGHSAPRNIIQGSNGNAIYLKEWKHDNFKEIFARMRKRQEEHNSKMQKEKEDESNYIMNI